MEQNGGKKIADRTTTIAEEGWKEGVTSGKTGGNQKKLFAPGYAL